MDDLKVCRICLRTDKFAKYYKLEEFFLKCYYEEITSTPVNVNDGLPKYFCYQCSTILNKYHFFKEKCCFAQKALIQMARVAPLTYDKICNMYSRKHPIIKRGIIEILKADKKVKTFNFQEELQITPETKTKVLNIDSECDNFESNDDLYADSVQISDNDDELKRKDSPARITYMEEEKSNDKLEEEPVVYESAIDVKVSPMITFKVEEESNDKLEEPVVFAPAKDVKGSARITFKVEVESNDKLEEEPVVSELARDVKEKKKSKILQRLLLKQSKNKKRTSVKKKTLEVAHKPETEKRQFTKSKDGKLKSLQFLDSGFWKKLALNEEEALKEFQAKAHNEKYLHSPYKCTDCLKAFSQKNMLERHLLLRHKEAVGSQVCRFCKERFKQACYLRKHMKQHYTKYECLRCDLVCNVETTALFHEEYHSGVTRKCPHCKREFKHMSSFYAHLRTHRSKHMCSLCGESFVSPLGLRQHKRLKHVIAPDNLVTDGDDNTYCDVCKITFETKEAYTKHLLHSAMHTDDSTPGGNGSDDIVDEGEDQSEDPDAPKQLHERKSKVERTLSAVRKNNLSVVPKWTMQPTTCQHCGKHFPSQYACRRHHLAKHLQTPLHTEEDRVICEICGASLAPGSVAVHMNKHTRQTVFTCETCGKSFTTKNILRNHMATHTGEKNHVCNLCGKRYSQNGGLNLHYRTIHLKQPYISLARLRSTDSERSRSLTLGPERTRHRPSTGRRVLLHGLVEKAEAREPKEVSRLPQRPNIRALGIDATPGGSLSVTGERVDIVQTPDDVPLCSDVLVKVEAMDMSEEESEELLKTAPCNVQRWVGGAGEDRRECLTPSVLTEANVGRTNISNTKVTDANITKVFSGADAALISEVDAHPSTSDVTATSKQASRHVICDGSDLDSEVDDEFDVIPVETTARALLKDIPDDEELEEPVRDIVNKIERGMDDEADRLLGISSYFTWVQGFDSFRGMPEVFSGPTPGPIKDYDSPYDAFTDIWDKSIIELIVLETNRYAKQTIEDLEAKENLKPFSRLREWTDTNVDEIMSLFAMFIYMGLDSRTSQHEYWTLDVLEMPKFRRLMPYNRYVLLNKFLHFVDNQQIGEISSATSGFSNRLKKLTPILEHLGQKFFSLYNLGCNVSIDESLSLFKGSMSWVQTIRSKAARFGIKSYELCESQTGYMARFQIYTSKTECAPSDLSPCVDLGRKSMKVVLELLRDLENRGHCVTMDNFYNCPSLARYLKSRGFDCLGTLRPSRRNVPREIVKVPKNVAKGTIISRQCGDISIVTWKDSKLVNMISTYHDDGTFTGMKAGKPLVKPKCVRDYIKTMGGIDLKDQKLSMYLLERKRGMKWYLKMFKRLLNVSIMNAFIMYASSLKRRDKLAVTHREFRYKLADSLIRRHAVCQPEVSRPVAELTRLRRDILHEPKYERGANNRKRCAVCVRLGVNKMVHSQCVTCGVFLCFGDCWTKWHSSNNLEGREVPVRKKGR